MTDAKITKLADRCKGRVTLDINEHKSYHQDVADVLFELASDKHEPETPEIRDEIIKRDMLIRRLDFSA